MHQQGRLSQAEAIYVEILQSHPQHFDALQLLATIAVQRQDSAAAVELFDRALKINPGHAGSLNNRGNALRDLHRPDEALESYGRALRIEPDYAEALYNRGRVLHDLKRLDAALENYDRALEIKPDYANALYNRGNALCELKRFDDALDSYDRALTIRPDHAEALNNRGNALRDLARLDEALASYDRALKIEPDHAAALYNRGLALHDLNRLDEALESYDRALRIEPDYAEALYSRGRALHDVNRLDDALECYDRALKIKPAYAGALNNRGNALCELKRLDDALTSYDEALRIKPDFAEALYNRGLALRDLKRVDAALDSFDRALKINPDCKYLYGAWLHARMLICEWTDFRNHVTVLVEKVSCGEKASVPFPVLAISSSPALQQKVAVIWVRDTCPLSHVLPQLPMRPRRDKIRVGYFSADYYNHPTAYLMAELFERHDRSRFELTAFSFGPDTGDEMRRRVMAAFDRFIDVRTRSDKDVALLARSMEIDIAVDLKGITQDCRPDIFALRASPIQVNYLGYPATMGAEYMDYLIADRALIPEADQRYYTEKIACLPDSYQVNDRVRRISDRLFTRAELGLPRTGFVFCCFNNNYKITPEVFDGWMRILRQVEGGVLWLLEDNPTAAGNLSMEAVRRGVNAERLVFAKRMSMPEHLARHRAAELFLDTLPYNAHTTASDALWAGVPVLTRVGETFAGRVGKSLLTAIHLPELITSTPEEYEALAIELATRPEKLRHIKQKLEHNRLTTPLFDTDLFARHIEVAYAKMYERYHAGLPPATIDVPPL